MADDSEKSVEIKTDGAKDENSSSDDDNSNVNIAENEEPVKTFKDLVSNVS